jgi:hypothetical protein
LPLIKVKPRELKVSGLPNPRCAPVRRVAAELDQAGLFRLEPRSGSRRQRELLKPRAHRIEEPMGIGLVLEAGDDIIRVTHNDHVAGGLPPTGQARGLKAHVASGWPTGR